MPDICVTMLFMVFCCCSTDIILNRFPVGRNDRFPFTITIVPVCKRLLTSKGFFIRLVNLHLVKTIREVVRVSISVRAHLPVTLVIVGCKGTCSPESVRNSSPNDSVVHQDTTKSGLQHLIRRIQSVHDMCGRECRLLNILKIIMGVLIQF
jgi:hypothetical protein